ncbi:MAG: transporter [Burkholderiaceae bacterium]
MRHRLTTSFATLASCALMPAFAAAAGDDDRPDAVPYRPTVSTPAALSAPGWLEGEFGGLYLRHRHADDGPERRSSLPYTIKFAFTEDWGIRVGGEAIVHAAVVDGSHETGFGDTAIVAKRRFEIDKASAFGLEAGVTIPTAKPALASGSGKPDWSINGIYSADLPGGWHADVNLLDTRSGSRQGDQSRWQTLGAIAMSRPLDDRWTAAAEISGTHQHDANGTAQVLGALSCAIRRDIVIDFGTAHGLNRATPTWQAFAGVTVLLGKVY